MKPNFTIHFYGKVINLAIPDNIQTINMPNHHIINVPNHNKLAIVVALVCIIQLSISEAATKPQRIVSMNLCTDQLLLLLVPAERIVSVSALSLDPNSSYMAEAAQGHNTNHGKSEEILPLKPDLVLASGYAARPAVELLRKLGHRVEMLPMANSIAGIRENISSVAALVGEEQKGAEIIEQMDRRVAQVQTQLAGIKKRAIFYQPRGYTSGSNTLQDEALRIAGWENVSANVGIEGYRQIGLEKLLLAQPEQIFTSSYAPGTSSMAQRKLQHPVLRRLTDNRPMVEIDYRLWICDGPMIAEAIEALAAAHR
jgi:iron complex transport system substrate-binding protein